MGDAGVATEAYADGEGDPCPNCGRVYAVGEFWIACDFCDAWYDGECVAMTPAKAQRYVFFFLFFFFLMKRKGTVTKRRARSTFFPSLSFPIQNQKQSLEQDGQVEVPRLLEQIERQRERKPRESPSPRASRRETLKEQTNKNEPELLSFGPSTPPYHTFSSPFLLRFVLFFFLG